jgi:hypothetical protein
LFTIPRVNVIESDEGFSVEVLGRTGLLYSEGDRSLRVNSEVLAGPAGMAVYSRSIRNWSEPHEHEEIDTAKRETIMDNIRRAFRFRGVEIDVS